MPGTTIDTIAAPNDTFTDPNPADTVTIEDGPLESGFQTTEIASPAIGAYIFANKTNFTFNGDNQGDNVILDNPDPATGLSSLTITNLGGVGSITGGNPAANGPDIDVATLNLQAPGNIGTPSRALKTQVSTLAASVNGSINIANGVAAPVVLSIAGGSLLAPGALTLTNNGTIDALTNGDLIEAEGNLTVKALGANADINLGGQTAQASINALNSGSVVDVEAGQDMNLGNSAGFGAVESEGSINLVAGRNLIIDANALVDITGGTGGTTATAGGDFLMLPAPGTLAGSPFFQTLGGAIALSAGAGHLMTIASTGTNAVVSNGGAITLTADDIAIAAGVTATTSGNVLIQPASAGQTIGLGSGMGGLELTNAALNEVTAQTLTIGNATAGSVNVGGTVAPAHVTNLTIDTAGGFTLTSGSLLEVAGTITINIGMSGVGATADLRAGSFSAVAVDVTGGAGNDLFLANPINVITFTGGGGQDTFEGTANALLEDTITDLSSGDKIVVTDANLANFTFTLTGATLDYSINGGTTEEFLTLSNAPVGHFIETADPVSGVDLTFESTPPDDFNGDGDSDILLRNANGSFTDWTMNGAQITAAQLLNVAGNPVSLDPSWSDAGIGDFNGDGKADILLRNTNGSLADWTMNGAQIAASQLLTIGGNPVSLDPSWSVAGVGDFNGDSKADILLRNINGSLADWTMNGSQITNSQLLNVQGTAVSLDPSWSVAGVGDFNGDGKADILLRNTNGSLADWTMNGSQITASQLLTSGGSPVSLDPSWSIVGVGDFNGDGDADILLRNANGSLADWTMNGSQIASAQLLTAGGSPVNLDASWSVVEVGDFNGDGKADILLRNTNGSLVDWTMNGSQVANSQMLNVQGNVTNLDNSWQTEANPATGGPGTQIVTAGSTVNNPTIAGGVLDLMSGAIVNGPISFVPGTTGTLLDADQANLPDTVMGFTEGADYLSFSGETSALIASVVGSQQLVNGNTVLTFPDSTSLVLVGITHADTGFFT